MSNYYPVPMHMHSIFESSASMEGHFYNAQKLGIKHMYITDHDTKMCNRKYQVDNFDFSLGTLRVDEDLSDPAFPRWYNFDVINQDENTSICIKDGALNMEAASDSKKWTTVSATFFSSQKRHERALLQKVFLNLGMLVSPQDDDMRVIIDVTLSQRPPEMEKGHIVYVFGNTDGLDSVYNAVKPLKNTGDFEKYRLNLLRDAKKVGGGDNVLCEINFSVCARNNKSAKLLLNHLSIECKLTADKARKAQQKLANKMCKKYGVTPFVINEITGAGHHKVCFSTKVPVIDYAKLDHNVSDEYAREHVKRYNGIFSRNHPFDPPPFEENPADNEEIINKSVAAVVDDFIKNKAWGATLLEVGFTSGRGGFPLKAYLDVWDALSKNGIFISGYGDSDSHNCTRNCFEDNNFVGYIFAKKPCEKAFVNSMRSGNLYTGDPVYMQKIGVSFKSSNGQTMGQVTTSENPGNAVLTLTNVPSGCRVIWTVNGQDIKEVCCAKDFSDSISIPTTDKVNFVRAALYKDERCIMLTNPLYQTTDKDVVITIPKERMFSQIGQ
ncbi:MAG: hypothetical protein E7410_03720 [Ruminococcaceae bacterium]|nr:hypothetical protein [Oscillospiraceae bacterium]